MVAEIPAPGGGEPLALPPAAADAVHCPGPGTGELLLKRAGGVGFRNPYTFVPALDRDFLPAPFADAPPPSHARYDPAHPVGRDPAGPADDADAAAAARYRPRPGGAGPERAPGHAVSDPHQRSKLFDVRIGPDGKPVIHGTALKGALRSAYEMITASRFGVFHGHDAAARLPARRPRPALA